MYILTIGYTKARLIIFSIIKYIYSKNDSSKELNYIQVPSISAIYFSNLDYLLLMSCKYVAFVMLISRTHTISADSHKDALADCGSTMLH